MGETGAAHFCSLVCGNKTTEHERTRAACYACNKFGSWQCAFTDARPPGVLYELLLACGIRRQHAKQAPRLASLSGVRGSGGG